MSDSHRQQRRQNNCIYPQNKPRFLGALLFTHMTQGLTTTLPYVIAVYMVRDFLAAQDPDGLPPSEEQVGTFTGLLGATFCAAQLITSYPLGLLSDIIGRRLIIILGNISCVIGVLFFGLSSNYSQAVVSRLIAGFFNAIIGAEKAMIGESLNSADQAKTMGHISLMWGIGTMIGPTMGGILAKPCDPETGVLRRWSQPSTSLSSELTSSATTLLPNNGTIEGTIGWSSHSSGGLCSSPNGLLFRKPYFLPCVAASFLSVVAAVLTIFYLDETLPRSKKNRGRRGSLGSVLRRGYVLLGNREEERTAGHYHHHDHSSDDDSDGDEHRIDVGEVQLVETTRTTTVLQIEKQPEENKINIARWKEEDGEIPSETLENTNNNSSANSNRRRKEAGETPLKGRLINEDHEAAAAADSIDISLPWYKQRNVLLCLAGYALIAFCYILLDELIPIYASARVVDGGLGFPTSTLARPLAFGGFVLVVWALFGFPWLHSRMGAVKCTTLGLIQTAPVALMIPAATCSWAPPALTMWLAMGFKAISGTNAFTGCIILVNAVAPQGSLGAVNGVGQTLASAVRAAGPALGGLFWAWSLTFFKYLGLESSWGHQFLPFLFASVVALATLGVYAKVKLPMETQIIGPTSEADASAADASS